MTDLKSFDAIAESRQSSIKPLPAAQTAGNSNRETAPAVETNLQEVGAELAEQAIQWAKDRPVDYEVKY